MKRIVLVWMGCMGLYGSVVQTSRAEPKERVTRESTEWCEIKVPGVNAQDKPHVLLVGDSITKGYYDSVAKNLKGIAYCSKFVSSVCVSDPFFFKQLELMFDHYEYAVIHFNNGLHGFEFTEEEYRAGYGRALAFLLEKAPSAQIVLVLSTPTHPEEYRNFINPRIDERNRMVCELAEQNGLRVNNLHSLSENRPEDYRDYAHFTPAAIALQGKQVGEIIKMALDGRSAK